MRRCPGATSKARLCCLTVCSASEPVAACAMPLVDLAAEMEWLRRHAGAYVAAVDVPSGVDADSGVSTPGAVTADVTFMIGNAKRGLLASHAVNAVGALALVPVEILAANDPGEIELICPQEMDFGKSPRPYDFHKGLAGRVAVIAGSARYPGAAVLAATGALRGGAGLITLHVPRDAAAVIAAKCPPEIIIHGHASIHEIGHLDCDAMVVGCGMGELAALPAAEFLEWLGNQDKPAVIDADALNLIATSGRQGIFQSRHVLTPHPGEFRRLAPELADLPRETGCQGFCRPSPVHSPAQGREDACHPLPASRFGATRPARPAWPPAARGTCSPGSSVRASPQGWHPMRRPRMAHGCAGAPPRSRWKAALSHRSR